MTSPRDSTYRAFNFVVEIDGVAGAQVKGTIVGGFSDVTGLAMSVSPTDFRNASRKPSNLRKAPGTSTSQVITLKRGVVGSGDFLRWLQSASSGVTARRNVTITVFDETRRPVSKFTVHNAMPVKFTGPGLNATNNEVAMEELQLTHEGIEQVTL